MPSWPPATKALCFCTDQPLPIGSQRTSGGGGVDSDPVALTTTGFGASIGTDVYLTDIANGDVCSQSWLTAGLLSE